jgi:16S rRNA processing protein RimM
VPADTGAGPQAGHSPRHLIVGHITKAHGTRGELFVWPLTDHPDRVFVPGRQLLVGDTEGALPGDAPSVVVESVRPFKRGLLVRLAGIDGRDTADTLVRRYVLVPTDVVTPAEADELFYHELLGMLVETVQGDPVGRVSEVFEAVPDDLLEVSADDGRARLIPFAGRIVRQIDRPGRRLVIDPPPGLLEL